MLKWLSSLAFRGSNTSRRSHSIHDDPQHGLPGLYKGSTFNSIGSEFIAFEPAMQFGLITSDGLQNGFDWVPSVLLEPLPALH